jgi:hemoglobin-like flavoprotein
MMFPFLFRYFQKYPDNKNFFSAFRDEDVERLTGSIVLRAHGTIVMQTIMTLLDNLDEPDTIKRQLYRIVGIHYDMGIRLIQYQVCHNELLFVFDIEIQ